MTDAATLSYLSLAERVHGNDLRAILALAEGLRLGDVDPDPQHPPLQPVLFATGGDDPIIERSRALAAATPRGTFIPIPGRHHFNTPGSRIFREAALRFLA